MKTKDVLNLIDILENMAYVGELMSEGLYKTSNYESDYTCYWRNISSDLEKLKEEIIKEW